MKMKKRIEKQISQRTEMLSGISHDLRTPLTRMRLQLALINDKEQVEEIEENLLEMEKMINAYLDFARGEGGEKTQDVAIFPFLSKIIHNYKKQEIGIELNCNCYIKYPMRKEAMKRVIGNLIDNSIKFANKILVSADSNEEFICISIEDDGPGIAESERENVFKPFYRIEPSRNQNTGGIGLGLAIVRDIISNHGGEIRLSSSKKLRGLQVIITLPL
jgi:two-component system osmolarity sensor histidine kinase EnvZ